MGEMADYYDPWPDVDDDPPPPPAADEWARADGTRVKIADMTDSHLFFSLAKGYRGEYGPRSVAAARMPALEAEAAARLVRKRRDVASSELSALRTLVAKISDTASCRRDSKVLGRLVRKHLAAAGYRSEPL